MALGVVLVSGKVAWAQLEWLTSLNLPQASATVSQSNCLQPRLGASSPVLTHRPPASAPGQQATHWWARMMDNESSWSGARWTRVDAASGATTARAPMPLESAGCGAPITADGGRMGVEGNGTWRLSKFDAAGARVWQTTHSTSPNYYADGPIIVVGGDGGTTYSAGNLVRRVSASGNMLFEVATGFAYVRHLSVNDAGDIWVVGTYTGSSTGVMRLSASGSTLWSTALGGSCAVYPSAALLTSNDELVLAGTACGEGRVLRIDASGQIQWQRLMPNVSGRASMQLNSLAVDAASNIYVAGCAMSDSSYILTNAWTVAASWSNAGFERWSVAADVAGGRGNCSAAATVSGSGQLYIAASGTDNTNSQYASLASLWALDAATGAELWRHRGVLSNPSASSPAMALTADGALLVLGDAQTIPGYSFREATLRRINPAGLVSPLRLKILASPASPLSYREPFALRVGLRTAADAPAQALVSTPVALVLATGTGRLDGTLQCTIVAGASECEISGVRYDAIETGVVFAAVADGFALARTQAVAVNRAATVTTLAPATSAPYAAFSVITLQARVQGPPPAANHSSGQVSLNGSPLSGAVYNCNYATSSGLTATDCSFLVHSTAFPLTASYVPGTYPGAFYDASTSAAMTLPVTKAQPTIVVSEDAFNTYVVGDRLRFRVAVMAPGGFNATPLLANNAVQVSGGSCMTRVSQGYIASKYEGSYVVCEVVATTLGTMTFSFDFAGNTDLLPAVTVQRSVNIRTGAVLRGLLPTAVDVTACSTAPGMQCAVTDTYPREWQCVGPDPSSGQVFMVPTQPSLNYYFPSLPYSFSNVGGGAANLPAVNDYRYQSSTCRADVDGDGSVMAMTDGVLILRRMLGLTGAALVQSATHSCVPLSSAGIAANLQLSAYDLDGDGVVTPATDGLLLLRALLGFRNDALVRDAIGASATRRGGGDITNFLTYSCGFTLR